MSEPELLVLGYRLTMRGNRLAKPMQDREITLITPIDKYQYFIYNHKQHTSRKRLDQDTA